ncbi:MAG: tetratricopeptide repeat protein [Rhodothermaceae bacterium]|nr:tetratricopeptide repeat protein [Rhodothermaceae bacterium]
MNNYFNRFKNSYACRLAYMAIFVVLAGLTLGAHSEPVVESSAFDTILDDPRVQELGKKGLNHLYNMEKEKAAEAFGEIEELYPRHPIAPFLKGLNIWWDIMIDLPNDKYDEDFYREMGSVIKRSNRMLKRNRRDFDAMFFKGAALGFRGRLRSNRGIWFKAALDGKNAMDYVLAIAEKEDENADYGFGKGIYDYFSVVIPEQYPAVRPFTVFVPKGNKERGIENLERTMAEGYFIRTEAAYFLLQIYYTFEKDFNKSRHYIEWLRSSHPSNSFFHVYEGRVFFRWGRWGDALPIFEDVIENYEAGKPGYSNVIVEQALYYAARCHMVYRRLPEAMTYLTRMKEMSEQPGATSVFRILALLRIGMVHDAQGEREKAVQYYNEVLSMDDWAGAHKQATRYLEKAYK